MPLKTIFGAPSLSMLRMVVIRRLRRVATATSQPFTGENSASLGQAPLPLSHHDIFLGEPLGTPRRCEAERAYHTFVSHDPAGAAGAQHLPQWSQKHEACLADMRRRLRETGSPLLRAKDPAVLIGALLRRQVGSRRGQRWLARLSFLVVGSEAAFGLAGPAAAQVPLGLHVRVRRQRLIGA